MPLCFIGALFLCVNLSCCLVSLPFNPNIIHYCNPCSKKICLYCCQKVFISPFILLDIVLLIDNFVLSVL